MRTEDTDARISNALRAQILVEALPYLKKYSDQILVIKYGGHAMQNRALQEAVIGDLILLSRLGVKVVLVHGGGPEISSWMKKIGKEPEFVDGMRVTDAEAAELVQMVLAGKINKELVNLLQSAGCKAIGISGADGNLIEAASLDPRLGFVGEVTAIRTEIIHDLLNLGYVPVIATVGCDAHGQIWNVNADIAAGRIAGALQAKALISLTDVSGILRDPDDPESLISVLHVSDAPELMHSGAIQGGMIPKVNSCIEAIRRGVPKAFILDGRVPHAILIETLTDEGLGTMLVKESYDVHS